MGNFLSFSLSLFLRLNHIDSQPDDLGLNNSEFKDYPHTVELCVIYAICHGKDIQYY